MNNSLEARELSARNHSAGSTGLIINWTQRRKDAKEEEGLFSFFASLRLCVQLIIKAIEIHTATFCLRTHPQSPEEIWECHLLRKNTYVPGDF